MSGYRLTVDAAYDLSEIWEFIAQDSLDAADRWIARLYAAFDLLGESPGIGHSRRDLTAYGVLFWSVGKYLIVYRTRADRIEIVAVTQGARDIPAQSRLCAQFTNGPLPCFFM